MERNKLKINNYPGLTIQPLGDKDVNRVITDVTSMMLELKDYNGLTSWYSAGTALAYYRDGKHIKHDTDVDIEVLLPENQADLCELRSIFLREGYKFVREMNYEGIPQQWCFIGPQSILVDIYFYQWGKDECLNKNEHGILVMPTKYIENLSIVNKDKDGEFLTLVLPNPIEEYLRFRYGSDWKIPKNNKGCWKQDAAQALKGFNYDLV